MVKSTANPKYRDFAQMTAASVLPGLYMVATPIGAARDITLRALDILSAADVIAAEDTRTTRKLMEIHGIPLKGRTLWAYHDHNAAHMREKLLDAVRDGQTVACVSEAGTPMISDPGFDICRAVADAGLPVFAAPGASALLAALTVAGLPTDRFLFAGFPPTKKAARRRWLQELATQTCTVVLYESPRRVRATLTDLVEITGAERPAALCRELTKKFEETLRGPLKEILAQIEDRPTLKGEIVLVLGGGDEHPEKQDVDTLLADALANHRTKDAVALVAEQTGLPKKDIYSKALQMKASD